MHLRSPSHDRGVTSFIWTLVFFVFMYFGMVLIQIAKGTALVVALAASIAIFVFVRLRGGDQPSPRPDRAQRWRDAVRLLSSRCASSLPTAASSRSRAEGRDSDGASVPSERQACSRLRSGVRPGGRGRSSVMLMVGGSGSWWPSGIPPQREAGVPSLVRASVGEKRVDVDAVETVAPVQERELDDEERAHHRAAELVDEVDLGTGCPAGGEHVVEHDHA